MCAIRTVIIFTGLLLLAQSSFAQDLEPRRWSHLPSNTNILGGGYGYTDADIFFDPVLQIEDVELSMNSLVLRYIRTFELLGKSARAELIPIYQRAHWKGLVAGEPREAKRIGFADPIIRFAVNLLGAPPLEGARYLKYRQTHSKETIVGAALAVHLPIGEYHSNRLLNLGSNRFIFRPQLGVVQNWGQWSLELTGATWFFTDNDNFYGGVRRKQDPFYTAQSQLVYEFKGREWLAASIGYGKGSSSTVDGVNKYDEKEDLAWALSFGVPVAKRLSAKIAYIGTEAHRSVGFDSSTISAALVTSW